MKQVVFGEELVFDKKEHAYTWGGRLVPGVTTVLGVISKPQLIQWSANMASDYWRKAIKSGQKDLDEIYEEARVSHSRKKDSAGASGTNVHDYAECYFKKLPLPELLTDQAKRGVEAFHKWLDSHHVEIIASERRVFSKQFYYAGTCDFVAKIDGVFGLGDIKTSSGIYPEMRLQTAAYQQALEEEKGIKFPVRWIIRFDKKTGEFETKSFRNFDTDFLGFSAALTLHKALQTIKYERSE